MRYFIYFEAFAAIFKHLFFIELRKKLNVVAHDAALILPLISDIE